MTKRPNYRYAIVNDKVIRVIANGRQDNRYECIDDDGNVYVVSKYDIFDTLHEAKATLEDMPE